MRGAGQGERSLPKDSSGFRIRGTETTRIETFTDAAFAFALTLLVVSLEPPTDFEALIRVLRDVPAFLMSASLLMLFWWGHERWSRRYGLDDGVTVLLSCVLVFTVLVYVYPLRFISGLALSWISVLTGLPVGSGTLVIRGPADVNGLFVVYGLGFLAMSGAMAALHLHAYRRREVLGLDALEQHETRASLGAWALLGTAGLGSVLLSLWVPATWVGVPGWAYMLLPVAMPLFGARMGRRRKALMEGLDIE